jgi:hypothetical protein
MTSAVGAAQAKDKSQVPARIILSRKGWDSKAGGFPNPVLQDGFPLSLPIPDGNSGIKYGDLYLPDGRKVVGELVRQLSKGKYGPDSHVHLDPDIRENAIQRRSFRAAFGQCGAAQSHLRNENVLLDAAGLCNDLFLYFGRFREVIEEAGRWSYRRGAPDVQLIFGWLQVGEIFTLANGGPDWAQHHPHCVVSEIVQNELGTRRENNNTLYSARSELTFCNKPGAGVFQYFDSPNGDPKRLTCAEGPASRWRVPALFRRDDLRRFSNIGEKANWTRDGDSWLVQRRGPGQEFVLETKGRERETLEWLQSIFNTA